ncbi:MAG: hypothetical protein AB7F88_00400 [Pyrinomonadaceae bacterium]
MREIQRNKIVSKLEGDAEEPHGRSVHVRPYASDEKMLDEIARKTGEQKAAIVRRMIRFALSDKFEHFSANPCRDRLDLLVEQGRKYETETERLTEILDRLKTVEENQRITSENTSIFSREIYSLSGLSVLVLNIILSRLIELTSPKETGKENIRLITDGAMQAVISQTILDLGKCCSFHGIDAGPQLMDELYFATRLRGLVSVKPDGVTPGPRSL